MNRDEDEEREIKAAGRDRPETAHERPAIMFEKAAKDLVQVAEHHPYTADRIRAMATDLQDIADVLDRRRGADAQASWQTGTGMRPIIRPIGYARAQGTAMAALSICEALALSLAEGEALDPEEIRGAFEDAMTAHRKNGDDELDPAVDEWAAHLIEHISAGFSRIQNKKLGG